MTKSSRTLRVAITAACACMPGLSQATDGYFSLGYGMKSKGMAGVSTARTDDAFGGANNPAQMVFAGSRFDLGVDWFRPSRDMSRSGASISPLNGSVTSDSNNFFIPEFGYNRMLNPDMSLGVTVYGNGGMNTDYPQGSFQCPNASFAFGPANALCGSGRLGVNLTQLIIAPTFSMKISERHALGVSPLLGYQQFSAQGLQAFSQMSGNPSSLSNNGTDSSTGYGVRLGYLGKLTDQFSVGFAWSSKMKMGSFDKYKGLFAGQGSFDMPSNFNIGFMWQASPKWAVGADFQRINYSSIAAVGNASTNQAPLGAANGPGFGWQDVNVVKVGVQYAYSDTLTLRAGYAHADNPVQARDVTFNILAPGVVQDHYTLGFSWSLDKTSELTMAYMHAPRRSVSGSSFFNAMFPVPNAGGTERISMSEDSLGIAYSKHF